MDHSNSPHERTAVDDAQLSVLLGELMQQEEAARAQVELLAAKCWLQGTMDNNGAAAEVDGKEHQRAVVEDEHLQGASSCAAEEEFERDSIAVAFTLLKAQLLDRALQLCASQEEQQRGKVLDSCTAEWEWISRCYALSRQESLQRGELQTLFALADSEMRGRCVIDGSEVVVRGDLSREAAGAAITFSRTQRMERAKMCRAEALVRLSYYDEEAEGRLEIKDVFTDGCRSIQELLEAQRESRGRAMESAVQTDYCEALPPTHDLKVEGGPSHTTKSHQRSTLPPIVRHGHASSKKLTAATTKGAASIQADHTVQSALEHFSEQQVEYVFTMNKQLSLKIERERMKRRVPKGRILAPLVHSEPPRLVPAAPVRTADALIETQAQQEAGRAAVEDEELLAWLRLCFFFGRRFTASAPLTVANHSFSDDDERLMRVASVPPHRHCHATRQVNLHWCSLMSVQKHLQHQHEALRKWFVEVQQEAEAASATHQAIRTACKKGLYAPSSSQCSETEVATESPARSLRRALKLVRKMWKAS